MISLNEECIELSDELINNKGFRNLCYFGLNASILLLDNNNISDFSPLNNDSFKNLQKLHLTQNRMTDLKFLKNIQFEKLIKLLIYI